MSHGHAIAVDMYAVAQTLVCAEMEVAQEAKHPHLAQVIAAWLAIAEMERVIVMKQ